MVCREQDWTTAQTQLLMDISATLADYTQKLEFVPGDSGLPEPDAESRTADVGGGAGGYGWNAADCAEFVVERGGA